MMEESVHVRVLFFAKSRELSGLNECNLELNKKTNLCSEVIDYICDKFDLNIIKNNVIIALNSEYCDDLNAVLELKNGDEIAVIPPISGG